MKSFLKIAGAVLLVFVVSSAAVAQQKKTKSEKPPAPHFVLGNAPKVVFSDHDREAIHKYYKSILGTLAPGSVTDRTPLPLEIDRELVPGKQIPSHYEKRLELLPNALEAQLSGITGDLARYKLGRHVILAKRATLEIVDMVRDVGWGEPKK